MHVWINGERRDLGATRTLGELLADLGIRRDGTAVAVNDAVIASSALSGYELGDGDAVEIIVAVAGG